MNWNEENFLERLMPYALPQPCTCPDAATICSVADGEAGAWICEQFCTHRVQCNECAELFQRIKCFQQAGIPASEDDWNRAEKRLQNWMAGFLEANSKAASLRAEPAGFSSGWKYRWLNGWRLPVFALGLAVVVASVTSVFWWKYGRSFSLQPQQNANVPAQPQAGSTLQKETSSSPKTIAGAPDTAKTAVVVENKGRRPKATSSRRNDTATTSQAQVAEGQTQGTAPASQASAAMEDTPVAGVQNSGGNPGAKGNAVAEQHWGAIPSPRNRGGFTPGFSAVLGKNFRPASAASTKPALPLASFSLPSGTRLWITLTSVSENRNGSFKFHGSLLLPVTQDKEIVLLRGVRVSGSANTSGGHISVFLGEVIDHGTPYRPQGASQPGNALGPGGGPGIQHESGKVLEMWLSVTTTYDRVTDDRSQK